MMNRILSIASRAGIPKVLYWKHLDAVSSKTVVLLYHAVDTNQFKMQMELLSKHFRIEPIDALIRALTKRRFPDERTAVITFDDGFRSFHTEAYPVVKEMGIPVTVYVPSAIIDSEMWVHPRSGFQMILNAPIHSVRMPIDEPGPKSRQEAIRKGYCVNKGMSRSELIEVDDSPLVTIGAHTVSHQELTKLSYPESRREIVDSKIQLEKMLGHNLEHFAYPRGQFMPRDVQIVKDTGFVSAASTLDAWVNEDSNIYAYPRLWTGPRGGHISWLYYALCGYRTPRPVIEILSRS